MAEKLVFVGGGNMATSLIGGCLAAGTPASAIFVAEPSAARADELRQRFGIGVAASAAELVGDATTVVLAVKPQQMREALAGLTLAAGATVVSIAAGVRIATLREALGDGVDYVRSMPNTPALFGAGIAGLYAPTGTPERARARAEAVLAAAGKTTWVQAEADLDAVTAVSGSGPAYYFLLTEVLAEAGVKLGLDAGTALQLAEQTLIGAARMVEAGSTDVVTLRAQVTSKGGTTHAAVEHLENAGLRRIFGDALQAAATRSRQLGDELASPPRAAG